MKAWTVGRLKVLREMLETMLLTEYKVIYTRATTIPVTNWLIHVMENKRLKHNLTIHNNRLTKSNVFINKQPKRVSRNTMMYSSVIKSYL